MFESEDLYRLHSLRNQGKLSKQQEKILEELQRQRRRQEEQDDLPDCPFCGNKMPKRNVSVCGHCRNTVFWHAGKVFSTRAAAEGYEGKRRAQKARKREVEAVHNTLREFARHDPDLDSDKAQRLVRESGIEISREQAQRVLQQVKSELSASSPKPTSNFIVIVVVVVGIIGLMLLMR